MNPPHRHMMRGAAVGDHAARRRPVVMAIVVVGLVIVAAIAAARGRRPLGEPADLKVLCGPDEGGEHYRCKNMLPGVTRCDLINERAKIHNM